MYIETIFVCRGCEVEAKVRVELEQEQESGGCGCCSHSTGYMKIRDPSPPEGWGKHSIWHYRLLCPECLAKPEPVEE